jgi:hypothetical protein
MNRFRLALIGAGLFIAGLVLWQPVSATILSTQAQIGITVVVNVTPSPAPSVGYVPTSNGLEPVIASATLRRISGAPDRVFHAESIQFDPGSTLVAQAQKPLLVQAEVTPNPNATLLYSNQNAVTVNAVAGTSAQVACAFTVTVDTTKEWELEEGVSTDFATGFPGGDLSNDTYAQSATPKPTSTPYLVYADDGGAWQLLASGTAVTTYCVTITINVPAATVAGTYTTNVIYTLLST